jgi:hypothetical protein
MVVEMEEDCCRVRKWRSLMQEAMSQSQKGRWRSMWVWLCRSASASQEAMSQSQKGRWRSM